jgi:hypothetical protein
MHGIERARKLSGPPGENRAVTRIVVHYADGRRTVFVPDAEEESFRQDDVKELQKAFNNASAAAEWAEITARSNIGG